MQKVESSSLFSRLIRRPRRSRGFGRSEECVRRDSGPALPLGATSQSFRVRPVGGGGPASLAAAAALHVARDPLLLEVLPRNFKFSLNTTPKSRET